MRKLRVAHLAVVMAAALGLSACESSVGQVLGFEKAPPDEFTVVKRAPLTMPPDFALRPPRPGEDELNRVSARESARQALLGQNLSPRQTQMLAQERIAQGQPASDVALLAQAQALNTDPAIRRIVNEESAALVEEQQSFVDTLVFWRDPPEPGAIVDATGEARRLQENASLGNPIGTGETPTIVTEEEAGLFSWPF